MTNDICDHLAVLAMPLPTDPSRFDPPDLLADAQDEIREQREDYAHNLRGAWDAEDIDPLLTEIARVRRKREEFDRQLRQLVAYGREFVGPRPYPLTLLANAAGLGSHSSARTFYGPDEIAEVTRLTGAKPRRRHAGGETTDAAQSGANAHERE